MGIFRILSSQTLRADQNARPRRATGFIGADGRPVCFRDIASRITKEIRSEERSSGFQFVADVAREAS